MIGSLISVFLSYSTCGVHYYFNRNLIEIISRLFPIYWEYGMIGLEYFWQDVALINTAVTKYSWRSSLQ